MNPEPSIVFGTASVEPEDAVADVVAVGAKHVRYGYGYDYPKGRRVKIAPPWPQRSNNQSSRLPPSMRCRSAAGVGLCGLGPLFGHRRASRALPAYNPVLQCRRSVFVLTNNRDHFLLCLRHQLAHAPKYAGAVNHAPSLPRFLAGRSQLAHALTVDQAVNDVRLNSAFMARLAATVQSAVDRFAMPDLGMQPLVDPATVRGDWHARENQNRLTTHRKRVLAAIKPMQLWMPVVVIRNHNRFEPFTAIVGGAPTLQSAMVSELEAYVRQIVPSRQIVRLPFGKSTSVRRGNLCDKLFMQHIRLVGCWVTFSDELFAPASAACCRASECKKREWPRVCTAE